MKKIIFIFSFSLMLIINVFAKNATPSNQKLEINSKTTPLQGYAIEGYNYYKLRDLANLLKGNIDFSLNGDDKLITINLNETYKTTSDDLKKISSKTKHTIPKSMKIKVIQKNTSKTYTIKSEAIDGYNYFKLRDLADILNYSVDYDSKNNTAQIFTSKAVNLTFDSKPVINSEKVILGNERLIEEYSNLIDGKNIGLITNMTGINSKGEYTYNILKNYKTTNLVALYSPEHGLDGNFSAGEYVESYIDSKLNLPVYSLYGKTREPSQDMLKGVDVLIFDMQDIGSRTYTYMSTLNYVMKAAKKADIKIVVLDRPNPLGDKVSGFTLKNKYKTFVGVDTMPMAHGMTAGELANFFNRNIGADLKVIEMKNYSRNMIWQDTGLKFVQTSPNIPNIKSAFLYMATGIGDGTGLGMDEKFNFVGAKNLNANEFAKKLNSYNLSGVKFEAKTLGSRGGVNVIITDYKTFNPQLTGVYILATANQLTTLNIPQESNGVIPMFEKIWGTDEMGKMLLKKSSPQEIEKAFEDDIENFKALRQQYLIY